MSRSYIELVGVRMCFEDVRERRVVSNLHDSGTIIRNRLSTVLVHKQQITSVGPQGAFYG